MPAPWMSCKWTVAALHWVQRKSGQKKEERERKSICFVHNGASLSARCMKSTRFFCASQFEWFLKKKNNEVQIGCIEITTMSDVVMHQTRFACRWWNVIIAQLHCSVNISQNRVKRKYHNPKNQLTKMVQCYRNILIFHCTWNKYGTWWEKWCGEMIK